MMSKAELEVLAKKYAVKADKAYRNYQETGISRYNRERQNAEELFYAFQAAANAAEEHAALIGMQTVMHNLANRAQKADTAAQAKAVLDELVSYARMMGLAQEDKI